MYDAGMRMPCYLRTCSSLASAEVLLVPPAASITVMRAHSAASCCSR